MNKQDYKNKAKMLHGQTSPYQYDQLPDDVDLNKVVSVKCSRHGNFNVKAGSHLQGKECPDCIQSLSTIQAAPQAFENAKRLFIEEIKPSQKISNELTEGFKNMPAFEKQVNYFAHFFYNYSDREELFKEYYRSNPNATETLINIKKNENKKLSIVFNEKIMQIMKLK